MGNAMPIPKPFLDSLIDAIREEGSYVLASSEDAEYFRKSFKSQNLAPKKVEPAPAVKQETAPVIEPPKPTIERPNPQPIREPVPAPKPKDPVVIESPQPPKPATDFKSVRNVLSVIAPQLAIIDEIPNDQIAKKLSQRWKTKNQSAPISILIYQEPPEQRALLEEIAKAIDVYYGPAKIVHAEKIEKEKQWEAFLSVENLKLVIACDYTLWQLTHLMHFYKETPAQNTRVLGNIPLFLLPDLSLYLKDALLKRSLWKALCQKCS